jgi:hypothetical protein
VPHLFWRRVKPVAVGPLRLCAHYFPPFWVLMHENY